MRLIEGKYVQASTQSTCESTSTGFTYVKKSTVRSTWYLVQVPDSKHRTAKGQRTSKLLLLAYNMNISYRN